MTNTKDSNQIESKNQHEDTIREATQEADMWHHCTEELLGWVVFYRDWIRFHYGISTERMATALGDDMMPEVLNQVAKGDQELLSRYTSSHQSE